ncbi:AraC-type DNA-binding protein [Sinomicrobium oceani]|uniref:AraC-type DNA-binding protein n=1 Tax=Sinomicrobium oceani TaxID=1150368 RepID=A0A1K1RVZ8_9FLAO|nr:AraC family transcriptional regulator [Sinomicrobium oceani]SFW76331.1 AraC-type DNA-binding protein [Sinomicrobium oceani]
MLIFKEEHIENICHVLHARAEGAMGYRLRLSKRHDYYNLVARYMNLVGDVHQAKLIKRKPRVVDPSSPPLLEIHLSKSLLIKTVGAKVSGLLHKDPDYFKGLTLGELLTKRSVETWEELRRNFLRRAPFELGTALEYKVNRWLYYSCFCYVTQLADGTIRITSFEKDRSHEARELMREMGISPQPEVLRSLFPGPGELGQKEYQEKIRMDKIVRFIEDHASQPLPGIKELAHRFNINEKKLNKRFKDIVGLTPYAYYMDCKLDRAMNLLRTTALDIDGVCESVGYHSRSGFYRAFKRKFGLNPGEVKREVGPDTA